MPHGRIAATIRSADPSEIPAILALQARALRHFARSYYAAEQIEAFLEEGGAMDPALVEAGRCRVLEHAGRILATGAWAPRPPLTEAIPFRRQPGLAPAGVIRAVHVDPDAARSGLGRAMVTLLEAEIRADGYGRAEFEATMPCVPFGTALGYWPGRPVVLGLAGGAVPFMGVVMSKPLPEARPLLAA